MVKQTIKTLDYLHEEDSSKIKYRNTEEEVTRILDLEDIKVTKKRNTDHDAHIYYSDTSENIIVGVLPKHWNRMLAPKRLVTICHEVTHLPYPHHRKIFWEEMISNLLKMLENREELADSFVQGKDRDKNISRSIPVFEVFSALDQNIYINCKNQTSMRKEEVDEMVEELYEEQVSGFFDQNPELANEWQRQYQSS